MVIFGSDSTQVPAFIKCVRKPASTFARAVVLGAFAKHLQPDNPHAGSGDMIKIIEYKGRITATWYRGENVLKQVFTAGVVEYDQSVTTAAQKVRVQEPLPEKSHRDEVSRPGFRIDDVV